MSNFDVWLQYVNDYWKNSFQDRLLAESGLYSPKYFQLKQSTNEEEADLKIYFQFFILEHCNSLNRNLATATKKTIVPPILELLFFIPGIILIPIIRTIYDAFTRPHYEKAQIDALKSKIASEPEKFKAIIRDILKNCYSYTSFNSRALSSDLKFILYRHLFQLQINNEPIKLTRFTSHDITKFWLTGLSRTYKNTHSEKYFYEHNCDVNYALGIIDLDHKDMETKGIDLEMIRSLATAIETIKAEQLAAIEDYLDTPENNGSKLMQSLFNVT